MVNIKLSQSDSLQPARTQPTLRWSWLLCGITCLLIGGIYLAQADLESSVEASPEAGIAK